MTQQDKYVGGRIDEYEIEKVLGRGGMGVVYRARDTKLKRMVAIKILPETALTDQEAVQRFDREARIVAEMNHPNVAQVFRIGEIDGQPYYVMEYIEGRSLDEIIKEKGRVGGTRSIKLMIQAARGLKAAAEKGIIHRDVKPANIMVTTDDQVKIVDFGIAKAFHDDTFKTATGMIMGTPRYLSPEQGRGVAKLDHRCDIYSLGATFYHVVAGEPPFDADNPITLIQKHIEDPVRDIKQFNSNVPEKVCNILYTMLEKRPADRFQDYNEIIVALENALGGSGGVMTYKVLREEPKSPAGRTLDKWKTRLLVATMVCALVLIAIAMFRPEAEEEILLDTGAQRIIDRKVDELRVGIDFVKSFRKDDEADLEGDTER